MKKTVDSLIKKISRIDPLRGGYLKRHITYDSASNSVIYTGDEKIIKSILKLLII